MGSNLVCAQNDDRQMSPRSPLELVNHPSPATLRSLGDMKTAQLCYAAARGERKTVESLLRAQVSVNAVDYDERSALHIAAENGHQDVVALLLECGAKVDIEDKWGQTPADCTFDPTIHELLMKAGGQFFSEAASSAPSKHDDWTSLKFCQAVASGDMTTCVSLLARRADVNCSDYDGRTPAHIAASGARNDVIEWLALKRADFNRVDHFGLTALGDAQRRGNLETAKLLEQYGSVQPVVMHDFEAQPWAIPSVEVEFGSVISSTARSIVYHATWRGTHVVVKMLKKDEVDASQRNGAARSQSKTRSQQFAEQELMHEITVLSKLRHPDLLMCLGACLDHKDGTFIVLEYLEGGDLVQYYAKHTKAPKAYRPPLETLLRWSCSVARALAFLHNCRKPIVHRDLKPMNLLLSISLDIKVSDFGISQLLEPIGPSSMDSPKLSPKAEPLGVEPKAAMPERAIRTEPKRGVGTLRYMAPEVVRAQHWNERVDIYSFGLVMYFMAVGQAPFVDRYSDVKEVMREYLEGKQTRPTFVPSTANAAYWKLMQEAWDEQPKLRPSAYDCAQRLAAMHAEAVGKKKKSFVRELYEKEKDFATELIKGIGRG